ncbi:MAG: CHAT domain-containing protein, partial [Kamptonema sp. SIO4C4]|nr:CHAT domain-containing protein [Kamptonema sp. SIO4C4]
RGIATVNNPADFLQPAQQLHDWLITPVEAALQKRGVETIGLILDAGLRSLPMAALSNGETFLIERYSLSLLPSLTLTDQDYASVEDAEVLAMGTEEFNLSLEVALPPLPAVPEEIEVITEELWEGASYLGEAFTQENLREARQQTPYGIVHLATHAEFQRGALDNSYIAFYDEVLKLPELGQLNLANPQVTLLVLSACRTAFGSREAELGFAGLAVGSGVKNALGSLWYISDQGTLAFMSHFYEELGQPILKAEALRQTQLSLLQKTVYFEDEGLVTPQANYSLSPEFAEVGRKELHHPYYWSAFTLIGTPW